MQPDLIEPVNQSGFPFQLGIANEIRQSSTTSQGNKGFVWEVISTEHLWTNPNTKEVGYIDIVVQMSQGIGRLVVECKRVTDADWIFLIQPQSSSDVRRARILSHETPPNGSEYIAWKDIYWQPPSYESSMCVLWRAKKNDPSLLEKIASKLIESVECLGDEESKLQEQSHITSSGVYIPRNTIYAPVLITNARLQICIFDPSNVSLDRGELLSSSVEFNPVPFIRFRKPIASRYDTFGSVGLDLRHTNLYRERTVFVVQAFYLSEFLQQCQILPRG